MALGFYRLDLGKDGLVSQEDVANSQALQHQNEYIPWKVWG